MWEWGRTIAEYAVAATWQAGRTEKTTPTITDPHYWETESGAVPESSEEPMDGAPCRADGAGEYSDTEGAGEFVRALAGEFALIG